MGSKNIAVEYRKVEGLVPYANNSRTHSGDQVEQIVASITEFGFTNPVLIDENGGLIAGHGRVMAATKMGMSEVPCIVLSGLSEAQKRAYIIADNKLALNAGWDEDVLAKEMQALEGLDFDLELTGFSFDEIDELDLLSEEEEEKEDGAADFVPAVAEVPVIKRGDLIELGMHRLLCGSATVEDDVLKLMGGDLADQLVTDPPYNVDYVGKTKDSMTIQNDSMDNDSFREFLRDAFANANAVMKEGGGILYMACGFGRLQFSWCVFRCWLESTSVFNLEKTNDGDGSSGLSLEARALLVWVERRCRSLMGYGQKTNYNFGI